MNASFSRRIRVSGLLLGATLAMSACGATTTASPSGSAVVPTDITIYVVGCAAPTGFHGYIARGAEEAGKNLGVKVVYIYPEELTLPTNIQKIEEAIAAKANGIAVCTIAEDVAYADVLARAKAAGIAIGTVDGPPPGIPSTPVKALNDPWLFRVGSDEFQAGALVANELLALGVKGPVVVGNQQPGDVFCQDRANGEIETLKAAGVEAELIELAMDPGQQTEVVTTYLRANPDTVAATSICDVIDGFLAAKEQANRPDLILTGFDVVSQSLDAIKDGRQAFGIDQQQYWRGYIPILLLVHNIKYGLVQANYFLTGPTVVDKDNIDEVADLIKAGYR